MTDLPVVTEEEQLGLAPLLCTHVDFMRDALPRGTYRDFTGLGRYGVWSGWFKADGTPLGKEAIAEHLTTYIEDT